MDISVIRERLHQYIDTADGQHLSAIYVLVGSDIDKVSEEKYDDETLDVLEKRMEKRKNGASITYSVAESFRQVRQHKK